MKKLSIVCLLIGFCAHCFSQENHNSVVPVELMLGNQRSSIRLSLRKPVLGKLTYMNQSLAMTDYKNTREETELIINNWIIYNVRRNIGFSTGLQYHFLKGLVPNNALHLNARWQMWKFALTQGVEYMPDVHSYTVAIIEFAPSINERLRFYSHAQAFYNYNFKTHAHARSFYYLRAGLALKRLIFGAGVNFDFYAPNRFKKENYGGFLKVLF